MADADVELSLEEAVAAKELLMSPVPLHQSAAMTSKSATGPPQILRRLTGGCRLCPASSEVFADPSCTPRFSLESRFSRYNNSIKNAASVDQDSLARNKVAIR
jgi:hypothetical protein